MKGILLCVLSLVAISLAYTEVNNRGCIYVNGRCSQPCPEGTHGYGTGCGPKLPEPTCDQPNPVLERGNICDYTACYCDKPTVRDLKTNTCVLLENCSKQEKEVQKKENEEKKVKKVYKKK